MSAPSIAYSPINLYNLSVSPGRTQVTLKVSRRYCNLNIASGIANFYIELTDGSGSYILPTKYYEWLAARDCNKILCNYYKIKGNMQEYNVLEIDSMNKATLETALEVESPLAVDCYKIMDSYFRLHTERVPIMRALNIASNNLAHCTGSATIVNNSLYVRALCSIDNLFSTRDPYLTYRKLVINNSEFITDVEVKV